MKDEFTINPHHGDHKILEDNNYRQMIHNMRCDLSNLASDMTSYLETMRVGRTEKETEEDMKIREYWESRVGQGFDRITDATEFLRYNFLGK